MSIISSTIYGVSPLDRLIAGKWTANSMASGPSPKKFHLIEDGKHYLVISKIETLRVDFFDEEKNNNKIDVRIVNKRYSFEEAKGAFPGAPESEERFVHDISDYALLELQSGKAEELTDEKEVIPEGVRFFDIGQTRISLSFEVRQGILGLRGSDHEISVEQLKRCISKKIKNIRKTSRTVFHFNDKINDRVLLLVLAFDKNQIAGKPRNITILTAYYPTQSYIKYNLNHASDTFYGIWKSRLPQL